MKDTEPKPHPTSKAVEYAAEQQERPTRKHRMVEKLTPDAQKVLQSILDTPVNLPLKEMLGNMPEVRKRLFQTGFTSE